MNKPRLTLIVARDRNGVIGINGKLPWHIPEDLRYFKLKTNGWPIIMGRKTFESIGKPLPGRLNVILSKKMASCIGKDTVTMPSIESALAYCRHSEECFLIGGAEVFHSAMTYLDRMLITEIDASFSGDCYFKIFPDNAWSIESKYTQKTLPPNGFNITFIEYVKNN